MKIIAFVDMHGSGKYFEMLKQKIKKEKPKLLLCAGDVSIWGKGLEKILGHFKEFNIPMLIIPGNHEDENTLKSTSKNFEFINYLHKGSFELDNTIFFGYGNDGFAIEDKKLESVLISFKKALQKDKKQNKKLITFTHGPPYGTTLDFLERLGYRGCKTITKMISELKPIVHICGHIHENWNKVDKIGDTLILNPGPAGIILEIE